MQAGKPHFSGKPKGRLTLPAYIKRRHILIAASVAGALILIGLGWLFVRNDKSPNAQSTTGQAKKEQSTSFNQVVAQSVSDFGKVCNGGQIVNAAVYEGSSPHPIAIFRQGLRQDSYSLTGLPYAERTWDANYNKPTTTQLVACLTRKQEGKPTKKCEYQKVSLDFIPVVYELTVYEARSRKKIGAREISGPAFECPDFVTYDEEDRKLYGAPDTGQIVEAVRPYVML